MEMGSGRFGFVTSGISEPGFDYWGFASTSPLRADCRGLETFPMSPVDLGCQFHVGNLAAMASSTCSMKCSNEPSRTLRVSLQKQHWVVPVEYLQQIFMGFGDLEAIHVSGQFPLEVLIQYNSIESAVAARYGCDGLYLDDNCCLVVKFSNQQIGRRPLQLQAEEIDGLRQGLEAMSSLINDFQSSLSSLRREINSDYESLLMRVKLGMGVAASLQAADANLGGVDLEENELHSDVTFKNDGVKEPTLGMKDLEASFPAMVNQFEAQMPVEMRSKSPGKNSVVEVKCIVWKPPMCLLKFQDNSYAQYATSECHLLLGNDSSTEGKDQQLRNSNDWFKAWNGELTFYKCIHDFFSAISGNPNNCDNMFIFGSILMNRKPEMYVPKEVGYPPPYGSIVASNKLMLRSKDYLRGGEFRGLGNMFLNKLVDTMSWKWIYVLFRLLVFNTLDSLDEYAIWWNFDLEMKLLMFHLPISAYGRPVPKLFIGSMTILSASLASLINVADIASNDVRLFSYNSLRSATMDLHPSNKIGGGGFGVVYSGVLRDNTDVAVKCLSAESKQGTNEFLTEINMISTIRHPNLVELIGCCVEGTNRILVYEYLENNSLANALLGSKDKRVSLDWPSRAAICTGTAAGLAFLHEEAEPPIVHRDIKASNVLLDANFHPKIGDFGLAKLFQDNVTHVSTRVARTIGYLAPEYAMLGQLTKKADVYSFGVLLLEIISGRSNSKTTYGDDLLVLLEWTWKLKAQDRLLEIVDPDLTGYPEQEVMRFIKVALFCTQASSHLRPGMKQVVEMLSRDVNLNESLLTELMVRIQVAQTVVLSAFS